MINKRNIIIKYVKWYFGERKCLFLKKKINFIIIIHIADKYHKVKGNTGFNYSNISYIST